MTTKLFLISLLVSSVTFGCYRPQEEEVLPIKTALTLKTVHHDLPSAEVNVFIKYDVTAFPGYDKMPAYFDTLLISDNAGRVQLSPVRPGRHWAVAFGASEHGIVVPIYGSMPFQIDVDHHPVVDTLIYMFE